VSTVMRRSIVTIQNATTVNLTTDVMTVKNAAKNAVKNAIIDQQPYVVCEPFR